MSVLLIDDDDAFKTTGYCVCGRHWNMCRHSSVCYNTCLLCMQYPAVDIQSSFLSVLLLELVIFYCQTIELLCSTLLNIGTVLNFDPNVQLLSFITATT